MSSKKNKSPEQLREELIGQLQYLVHEVESLKDVVERVPVKLQEGRPLEDDLSIKETYALLARLDEEVHEPFVRAIQEGEEPQFNADSDELLSGSSWNDKDILAILDRVQESRSSLSSAVRDLDADSWKRSGCAHGDSMDVYELLHFITQHDVDRMREIGYRLHESQISSTNG